MNRIFTILLSFLCICLHNFSGFSQTKQNSITDSLQQLIKISKEDTTKVNLLNKLSSEFENIDGTKSINFAFEALSLSKKINYKSGIAKAYMNIAYIYIPNREYSKAIDYCLKSLNIEKELNNKKRISNCMGIIGYIHRINRNPEKSKEYNLEALKIAKSINNTTLAISSLRELKMLYEGDLNNLSKALSYCKEIVYLSKLNKDTGELIYGLWNLGHIYHRKSIEDSAISTFNEAMHIAILNNDSSFQGQILKSIGDFYFDRGSYNLAFENFEKSYKTYKALNDDWGTLNDLASLGETSLKLGQHQKALDYLFLSLNYCKTDFEYNRLSCYKLIAEIYSSINKNKEAYSFLNKYCLLKDSLDDKDERNLNIKNVAEIQSKFEFDKIEQNFKIEEQKKEISYQAEVKQKNIIMCFVISILLILTVFSIILFRRFKITKQQKFIIEKKNEEVEEKNKEIMDSIKYAKRIQTSLLPTEKYIDRILNKTNKN